MGAHNQGPPVPKYCTIWGVNLVLDSISAMRIDIIMPLTQKVAMLIMILSGNRVNMISFMKITAMYKTNEEVTFLFEDPLKHSRENWPGDKMTYRAYPFNKSLCPVGTISLYLERREEVSGDPQFLVTTIKPFRGAHHDTIAGWVKDILGSAGIDTRKFQAHSCRAAATSKAALAGVSLSAITKSASWSNVRTLKTYYMKEISDVYDMSDSNFGQHILENYSQDR